MGGQCLLSTSLAANVVLLTLLSLLLTHSLHNCREVLLSSPRSLSGPSVVLNAVVTPGSAEVANDATANEEQQKHEEVAIEDLRTREPRRRRDEKVIKEEDKYEAKPQKPLPAPPSVSSVSSSSVSSSSVSSSSSSQSEKVIGSQKRKEIMQDAAFDLQDDDYVEKSFAADFAAAFDHDNDNDDDDDDDEDGDGERATMPRRLLLPEENPSSEASLIPRLGRKKRRSSDGLGNVGARSMNAKIQPREAAVGSRGRKQQEQEQEQKYHEEEAEAATALDSANRDNANATIFLPVFLKFHKVGGTTIASCLRARELGGAMDGVRHYWCCDRLRDQEGEGRKRAKKRAKEPSASASAASLRSLRSLRSSELYAETGCRSGGNAYEHNTLPVYQEYGLEGFRVCTLFRPNIVALALLRDPLQRWLSGLYYWGKVYTNPMKRICLARKFYAPLRHDIAAAYSRLVTTPEDVTVRDVDLMSMCIFGDRFTGHFHQSEALPSPPSSSTSTSTNTSSSSTNGGVPVQVGTWGEREIPGPPAGTPALEYAYWLASPANTTAPTRQEVAEAKRKLARDFTVGVTENMPSFFALVAMKLHWPLRNLCCIARNVNAKTGSQKRHLPDAVLEHGRAKLAADIDIYNGAIEIHEDQVERANAEHERGESRASSGNDNADEERGGGWQRQVAIRRRVVKNRDGHGHHHQGEHARLVRTMRSVAFARDVCHHDLDN